MILFKHMTNLVLPELFRMLILLPGLSYFLLMGGHAHVDK